jgi:flagellar biosynthesis protein FlhG
MLRQLAGQQGGAPAAMPKGPAVQKRKTCLISVTSGKGGVGKTNIVANLAFLLTEMKKKTLVMDADCGLANVDLILGLTPRYNLSHLLAGERTLQDILLTGPGGMKILPSSSGIQELSTLTMVQKLALQDAMNTLQWRPDFMLIDTSAGISENVMYFNMVARETIVIVTPEPTSLTDAYALIKLLYQRHAKKRFRLLVNMVKSPREAKEVFLRLSQATDRFLNLAIENLGFILHDENLPAAVKQQKLLAESHPNSPAVKCLREVAEKLCRQAPKQEDDGVISFLN